MSGDHVSNRLAAFADGELGPQEAAHVETHLSACEACREAWRRYQFAADLLRQLTPVEAPSHIWTSIEAALETPDARTSIAETWWPPRPYVLAVAAVLVAAIAGGFWAVRTSPPEPWDVVRHDDAARTTRLAPGEWIETDATSTVRIGIGEIGTVDVEPDTRLQLLTARPDEHRLNLAIGSISAEIIAPPRIFFVETPSSTVVDLGCAYTMQVDQDGAGVLRVTGGWAALEWDGRESLVPAGASAHTRPALGPGTPSFDDASERLRQALMDFDFGVDPDSALAMILLDARDRDTLTLWHLMSRVDAADRPRVFDRIVTLTPLPDGVDRDKALALDPDTMTLWREELAWTW